MATFLTRKGIVHHLDRIIDEAAEELILISPYIKADDETKNLLKSKTRDTAIHVIYGKSELNPGEKSFLDSLGIKPTFLKDLHAKCYLNEKEALLTSMNLYQFSQEHNDEMGILVSREDDPELYEDIYRQASRWKNASSELYAASAAKPKLKVAETRAQTTYKAGQKPSRGFCIRCKAGVAANPEKPYCADCFKSWKRYSNPEYKDYHCHICGKEHAATLLKPLCASCYKKYKDMFQFAAA